MLVDKGSPLQSNVVFLRGYAQSDEGMKSPTDVYNSLQVIRAHLDDLKVARAITDPTPQLEPVFGKTPREVFSKTVEILELIREILAAHKIDNVVIPQTPDEISPREIVQNTTQAIQHLSKLKRRLGAPDRAVPARASIRISPSHVFCEAEKVISDLQILRYSVVGQ